MSHDYKGSGFLLTVDSSVNANSTTHDIRQKIYPIKQLEGPASVALVSVNTYASWFNVSAEIGNNKFNYTNTAVESVELTIPDGVYSAASLFTTIDGLMSDYTVEGNGVDVFSIVFDSRIADNRSTVEISDGFTIKFDLCPGIAATLGFNATVVSASTASPNEMDLFNGLQELQVRTDLCEGSIENGSPSETIATFQSNSFAPNQAISIEPNELLFVPLRTKTAISNLRVWLTDQHGATIDLQGGALSFTFYVKYH